MPVAKYEIYSFWKDKAITNKFKIQNYADCKVEDEAVPVIEFCDDVCCWACGLPSLIIKNEAGSECDDLKNVEYG